jgi:hypothetical protein
MPKNKEDYYEEEGESQDTPKVMPDAKVIIAGGLVLLVIIIVAILAFTLISHKTISLSSGDEALAASITVSKDGKVLDFYKTDGNLLHLSGNPEERVNGVISTGIKGSKKPVKIVIIKSNGEKSSAGFGDSYIDENGNIHFSLDPLNDFNLSTYYDDNTGEYVFSDGDSVEFGLEIVISDDETGEDTIIDITGAYLFTEYTQFGCVALSRNYVKETTHYGSLELNSKMLVECDSGRDLAANVEWKGERMGNVEINFDNYAGAAVLSTSDKVAMLSPSPGEHNMKITFTPFKEYAGQSASFRVSMGLGTSKAAIDFDVVIDNLEQCVKITPEKAVIAPTEESTTMSIDVSECSSPSIDFALCANDPNCSGNTQGGIALSQTTFNLSPKTSPKKTVTITRMEISGAYGVPVRASIQGTDRVLIDDKLVIVSPKPEENIVPDKFVVSLLGGAKDSIRVRNKTLAEDVQVTANICSIYKNSMGLDDTSLLNRNGGYNIAAGTTWWADMYSNYDRYAGHGKYQAALVNTLYQLDNIRRVTQYTSEQKNSDIKGAYLFGPELDSYSKKASVDSEDALDKMTELKDASDEYNKYKDVDLAVTYTQFATSTVSFVTSATVLCTASTAAVSATDSFVAASAGCASGLAAGTKAAAAENVVAAAICGPLALQATGLYNTVNAMAQPTEDINPASAFQSNTEVVALSKKMKESASKTMEYLTLAMKYASIDEYTKASVDDAKAAEYLELAKQENQKLIEYLEDAKVKILNSDDEITTMIPQAASDFETYTTYASLATQAIGYVNSALGIVATGTEGAVSASAAITASYAPMAAECSANQGKSPCCATAPAAADAAMPVIIDQIGAFEATQGYLAALGALSIGMSGYSIIRQTMLPELITKLNEARTSNSTAVTSINDLYLKSDGLDKIIDDAISSADWLSKQEVNSSDASSFANEVLADSSENFNKKRMTGLIGSAIMTGFVNGAYLGGVYSSDNDAFFAKEKNAKRIFLEGETTTDEFVDEGTDITINVDAGAENYSELRENCANMVKLILPDYVINLLHDGKAISIPNTNVVAQWDLSDTEVFDVFEEQEAGVVFANSGLTQNTYGVVEFNVEKHVHAQPTDIVTEFGPFNLPDSRKDEMVYKYHFKFNAEPRKGNNHISFKNNSCSNGLFLGKTGQEGLPNVVLSWDWNSIKGITSSTASLDKSLTSASVGRGTFDEPYIDATQLSILVSKKLGSLSNFLDNASIECPPNPAKSILEKVRPYITDSDTGLEYTGEASSPQNECYLPLSTRTYDGKPALYYYLENATVNPSEDWFSDSPRVYTADEIATLLDFNVNLIRDGYGSDFQFDFYNSFTTTILRAGPSFLDPSNGAKKYFENSDRFYYSSRANSLLKNSKWVIPDAGKYRVRLLITFDGVARVFNAGIPAAKVIVDLYSLEPVNNNYSPLYYTPFDGFIGLDSPNNRKSYGTTASQEISLIKGEGVFLDPKQKDALVNVTVSKNTSFFLLNSLPSLRGKLLDYTYSYNPRTLSDANSRIIYSPTVATPLLMKLEGFSGLSTLFSYSVKKDNQDISSDSGNMFILSAVGDCSDLAGGKLSDYFKKSPDEKGGNSYIIRLPDATVTGTTFLKTIAYSPIDYTYSLAKPTLGQIYSSNDLKGIDSIITLEGIGTMNMNDKRSNSTPESLYNMLKGVNDGSICVSDLGNREVFWWPEDTLFEKTGTNGESISANETAAKVSCTKVGTSQD